jgi:hypothetical protein
MVARQRRQVTASTRKPVYVYIWFDIEDYVTEESDDLPITAASILARHGARATCKMVAEKVRVLLERDRADVISAIAAQDVGYHLDTHSRHPTVYEYLADKDTLEGSKEFEKKEKRGLELVEKTFRRSASCYGHPGPAWASHYYPAMERMGIPVYLDETSIVNLHGQPYWYCGILNLNGANENFVKFDYTFESPRGLSRLKRQFKAAHDRLASEGGGSISFLFHLHTAINKEFWDAVNFSHGQNRSRSEYVRPTPQPAEVTERAWSDFDGMLGYMSSFEDVRFITASDATRIFRKDRPSYDRALIESVLGGLKSDVEYVKVGDDFASPSELFYLVVKSISSISGAGKLPAKIRPMEPLGPAVSARPAPPKTVRTAELVAAAKRLAAEVESSGRLPSTVRLRSGIELSPVDFMVTASEVLRAMLSGNSLPEDTKVTRANFSQSRFVNPQSFHDACKWSILPEGFEAPRILEELIQQTWTLRPAVPGISA